MATKAPAIAAAASNLIRLYLLDSTVTPPNRSGRSPERDVLNLNAPDADTAYATTAEETLKTQLSWRRTWYRQVTDPMSGGRTVTRRLRITAQLAHDVQAFWLEACCDTTLPQGHLKHAVRHIVERTLKPTLFACLVQLLFSAGSS